MEVDISMLSFSQMQVLLARRTSERLVYLHLNEFYRVHGEIAIHEFIEITLNEILCSLIYCRSVTVTYRTEYVIEMASKYVTIEE